MTHAYLSVRCRRSVGLLVGGLVCLSQFPKADLFSGVGSLADGSLLQARARVPRYQLISNLSPTFKKKCLMIVITVRSYHSWI